MYTISKGNKAHWHVFIWRYYDACWPYTACCSPWASWAYFWSVDQASTIVSSVGLSLSVCLSRCEQHVLRPAHVSVSLSLCVSSLHHAGLCLSSLSLHVSKCSLSVCLCLSVYLYVCLPVCRSVCYSVGSMLRCQLTVCQSVSSIHGGQLLENHVTRSLIIPASRPLCQHSAWQVGRHWVIDPSPSPHTNSSTTPLMNIYPICNSALAEIDHSQMTLKWLNE